MGTTASGYPYPEDTDLVSQGAQAIKALANAVEPRAGQSASGKVTVNVNNVNFISQAFTLPAGRFGVAPNVVVTSDAAQYVIAVTCGSATTATVYLRQYKDALVTQTVNVFWVARS